MISVGSQGTGSNAKSDALGTKVFPVAGLAVDLSLPLAELAAVHPLVADVAGEAGLVPGLARRPHQLGDEDGLGQQFEHIIVNIFGLFHDENFTSL